MTQPSSVAASGAMPGDAGNAVGIVGRHPVDHGQPRLDRGAVLGIDRAVNRGGEDDAAAFLQPDEGVAPDRIVGRDSSRPVIATSRPPSGSRASAEAICRKAASAMRRSTLATAENGGFISTTLGMMPASR